MINFNDEQFNDIFRLCLKDRPDPSASVGMTCRVSDGMTSQKSPKTIRAGFTLIEMMVAVIVFTSVILIAAGSLNLGVKVKTRIESIQQVQDETRTLAEYISRSIEMAGKKDELKTTFSSYCDLTSNSCFALTLKNIDPKTSQPVITTIMPSVDGQNLIESVTDSNGLTSWRTLNSEKVRLTNLNFERKTGETYINVKLAFEEKGNPAIGSLQNSVVNNYLGKLIRYELQFTSIVGG